MKNLTGQVAIVTGGERGIGKAIALGLAKEGWSVAVVARSEDQLAETVPASACKVNAPMHSSLKVRAGDTPLGAGGLAMIERPSELGAGGGHHQRPCS